MVPAFFEFPWAGGDVIDELYASASGPQVKGHVAANLTFGNDRAMLIDGQTQLLPLFGYPGTLNGLRVIDGVTASASGSAKFSAHNPKS